MALNYFATPSLTPSFPTAQWTKGPRVRIDSLPVGAEFEDITGARARVTGMSNNGEVVETSNSRYGYARSAEVLVVRGGDDAIKFEKIEEGMELFDIHTEKAGNTTLRRYGKWPVKILSVDREQRSAMVSWNYNPPRKWYERDLRKLYAKVPPGLQEKLNKPFF